MLTITRDGDIVTVVETIQSFTETKRTTVRYNTQTWQSQINDEPWRDMDASARHWVVKHYLKEKKPPE